MSHALESEGTCPRRHRLRPWEVIPVRNKLIDSEKLPRGHHLDLLVGLAPLWKGPQSFEWMSKYQNILKFHRHRTRKRGSQRLYLFPLCVNNLTSCSANHVGTCIAGVTGGQRGSANHVGHGRLANYEAKTPTASCLGKKQKAQRRHASCGDHEVNCCFSSHIGGQGIGPRAFHVMNQEPQQHLFGE